MENSSKEDILNNLLKGNLIHKDDYDAQIKLLSNNLSFEDVEKSLKELTGS